MATEIESRDRSTNDIEKNKIISHSLYPTFCLQFFELCLSTCSVRETKNQKCIIIIKNIDRNGWNHTVYDALAVRGVCTGFFVVVNALFFAARNIEMTQRAWSLQPVTGEAKTKNKDRRKVIIPLLFIRCFENAYPSFRLCFASSECPCSSFRILVHAIDCVCPSAEIRPNQNRNLNKRFRQLHGSISFLHFDRVSRSLA